jgi:hypothetical protein
MAPRRILIGPRRLREGGKREAEKQIPHTARKRRERVRDDNWESMEQRGWESIERRAGTSSGRAAKLSVARVLGNEQKLRSAGILSLQLGEAGFLASR